MTPRERQPSGGAALAARPATAPPPTAPVATRGEADLWADLYHSIPPARQAELLALAARQGLLYAQQLPAPDPSLPQHRQQWLAQLVAGKVGDFPPFRPEPVPVEDSELDATQREAVARALGTPDVCLIQGAAGTGKSRVVAEIVTRAAARGERVLLLAPDEAALDRILEEAGQRESLCPVRCLGRGEGLESLSARVRAFTLDERQRRVREHSLPAARAEAGESLQRLQRLRDEQGGRDELEKFAAWHEVLADKLARLARRRDTLAEDVERAWESADGEEGGEPPTPFLAEALICRQERERETKQFAAARAALQERKRSADLELRASRAEIDALNPAAEAKRNGRWWLPAWWKATLRGGLLARHANHRKRLGELEAEDAARARDEEQLAGAESAFARRADARKAELVEGEVRRRCHALDEEEAALRDDARQVEAQWARAVAGLGAESPQPTSLTPAAVEEARVRWEELLQEAEGRCDFARRWADCLEEAAAEFPARLVRSANLVAATLDTLTADPHFGGAETTFDLLILEEAGHVSEAEFLHAARRARRWVVVGEPAPAPAPAPRRGDHGRSFRAVTVSPGFFQTLWDRLHASPRRLPARWVVEDGKLCCRLRPLTPEQGRYVECEPVADRPDVELCILAPPRGEPSLAEVRFPPGTTVGQAKEYLFRELQEVPARGAGRSFVWEEDGECVRLWLAAPTVEAPAVVALGDGVRELVRAAEETGEGEAGRLAYDTVGFVFDRAAGWTRERAEDWIATNLRVGDCGRTAYLDRPYRVGRGLSLFLSHFEPEGELARADAGRPDVGAWCGWSGAAVFVPVPTASVRHGRSGPSENGGGRGRSSRGGAGLERDLADAAARQDFPPELLAGLPRQGLVNFPEALAVVHALESLLLDPAFRADAAARRRTGSRRAADTNGREEELQDPSDPAVMVAALYASQARLIQLLLARSRVLSRAGLVRVADERFRIAGGAGAIEIEVGVPPAFRQRESLTLLLSLSRSHTHRAVPFGEHPGWLPLALTRPAGRLVLFGDLGTLARRAEWLGALDHLDEVAAGRERDFVAKLVRCVQGNGPASFQLCAGPVAAHA